MVDKTYICKSTDDKRSENDLLLISKNDRMFRQYSMFLEKEGIESVKQSYAQLPILRPWLHMTTILQTKPEGLSEYNLSFGLVASKYHELCAEAESKDEAKTTSKKEVKEEVAVADTEENRAKREHYRKVTSTVVHMFIDLAISGNLKQVCNGAGVEAYEWYEDYKRAIDDAALLDPVEDDVKEMFSTLEGVVVSPSKSSGEDFENAMNAVVEPLLERFLFDEVDAFVEPFALLVSGRS